MKAKKIFGLIATILMALPLFIGVISAGNVANAQETSPTEGHVNVTLHKRVWNVDKGEEARVDVQNTGEIMRSFGGTPLDGATFEVYDVTSQYYDYIENGNPNAEPPTTEMEPEDAYKQIQDDAMAAGNKAPTYAGPALASKTTATVAGETDPDKQGIATFENLPKENDGKDAVYLFIETAAPSNITQMAQPMVLSMPVYALNGDGTYSDRKLSTIHLYPKNIQKENDKDLLNADSFEEVTVTTDGNSVTYLDVSTGDILQYEITINVPDNVANKSKFEVTDMPDPGLVFYTDDEYELTIDGLEEGTDYDLIVDENGGGFKVIFDVKSEALSIVEGEQIKINYFMKVTAEVMDTGIDNKATIDFGTSPDVVTGPKVGTHGHKFQKVNAHGGSGLAGAEFRIYRTVTVDNVDVTEYAVFTNGILTAWTQTAADATTITSGSDGTFNIKGFQTGEYVIEETKAPTGFIITQKETSFEVKAGGFSSTEITAIANTPKGLLPETGGNGILAFLAIGLSLMLGAFVWYKKTKKPMEV